MGTAAVFELCGDPPLDVGEPVAEVASGPEPWGALPAMPPRVDGGDRHTQVVGEFCGGEQTVELVQGRIRDGDPVSRVSGALSETLQLDAKTAPIGRQSVPGKPRPGRSGHRGDSVRGRAKTGWVKCG